MPTLIFRSLLNEISDVSIAALYCQRSIGKNFCARYAASGCCEACDRYTKRGTFPSKNNAKLVISIPQNWDISTGVIPRIAFVVSLSKYRTKCVNVLRKIKLIERGVSGTKLRLACIAAIDRHAQLPPKSFSENAAQDPNAGAPEDELSTWIDLYNIQGSVRNYLSRYTCHNFDIITTRIHRICTLYMLGKKHAIPRRKKGGTEGRDGKEKRVREWGQSFIL